MPGGVGVPEEDGLPLPHGPPRINDTGGEEHLPPSAIDPAMAGGVGAWLAARTRHEWFDRPVLSTAEELTMTGHPERVEGCRTGLH